MNFPHRRERQELVDRLQAEGHKVDSGKLCSVLGLDTTPSPWYIQGLLGFAAWISAILFLFFLGQVLELKNYTQMFTLSILFTAGAIIWYRSRPDNIFTTQLTVILSIVGLILFEIGLSQLLFLRQYSGELSLSQVIRIQAFSVIIFELIVFGLQYSSMRRYIAINNIVIAFLVLIHIDRSLLSFQIAYILLASLSLLVWEKYSKMLGFKGRWQEVIRFSLPILLLALLLFTVWRDRTIYYYWRADYHDWWLSTLAIALVFIGLILRIYHRLKNPNKAQLYFSVGLVAVLAGLTYHSPGIIAALFVMVLAYAHGHRVLLAFSIAFLACFMVFYYYNMQLSLLSKSASLVTIGVVLLVAAWLSRQLEKKEGGQA